MPTISRRSFLGSSATAVASVATTPVAAAATAAPDVTKSVVKLAAAGNSLSTTLRTFVDPRWIEAIKNGTSTIFSPSDPEVPDTLFHRTQKFSPIAQLHDVLQRVKGIHTFEGIDLEDINPASIRALVESAPENFLQHVDVNTALKNVQALKDAGFKSCLDIQTRLVQQAAPIIDAMGDLSNLSDSDFQTVQDIVWNNYDVLEDAALKAKHQSAVHHRNQQIHAEREARKPKDSEFRKSEKRMFNRSPAPFRVEILEQRGKDNEKFFRISSPSRDKVVTANDIRTLLPRLQTALGLKKTANPQRHFRTHGNGGGYGLVISTTNPDLIQFLSQCTNNPRQFPVRHSLKCEGNALAQEPTGTT